MLYGRSAETAAIDDLIGAAAAGAGRALVLRGEAGVGKSSLLDLAASRATAMAAPGGGVAGSGVEGEADLAFAALHQLLRPVTGLLGTLPGPQRDAVSGALGLAAPECGPVPRVGGRALAAGRGRGRRRAAVLADDFQWFDRASADAVLFAARRLRTEKVSMLLAVRVTVSARGYRSCPVGGLDPESAVRPPDSKAVVAPGVRAQLVSLTGGNPLVLGETVALLSADLRLAGRAPLPDPLPGGEQLFGEQVARLSGDARRVLLVASLESDLSLVLYAAAHLSRRRPVPRPRGDLRQPPERLLATPWKAGRWRGCMRPRASGWSPFPGRRCGSGIRSSGRRCTPRPVRWSCGERTRRWPAWLRPTGSPGPGRRHRRAGRGGGRRTGRVGGTGTGQAGGTATRPTPLRGRRSSRRSR